MKKNQVPELGFDPFIHQKDLLNVWKKFIETGQIERKFVASHIKESWIRSRGKNIDPYAFSPSAYLDPVAYIKRKEDQKYLISVATRLMERVYQSLERSRYLVILYDPDGYHLLRMGQVADFERSGKFSIREGLCFDEEKVGTCGFSLVKSFRKPIQIIGCEHYCALLHYIVGSYAPISDPISGDLIGVLGIAGARTMPNLHTLGMAIATSSAIENYIKLDHSRKLFFIYGKALQNVIDSLSDGIIVLDGNGTIYEINDEAAKIFGLAKEKMKGEHLIDIIQITEFKNLFITTQKSRDFEEQEIDIEIRDQIYVTTIKHVQDTKDGIRGFMVQLKNLKNLSRIVHNRTTDQAKFSFDTMVGSSLKTMKIKNLGRLAARSDANIIIEGESGTGKEVLAQAIHNESMRKHEPFAIINCSAIPTELMESTLFGHEKGAFTGASYTYIGKFELGDKGTIFLDEIAEMPTNMQAKLLRVLEEKTIERVGGKKVLNINIRIIAATNRDLMKEVKENRFREDLFYRLNVFRIKIPPLRERMEEIYELVPFFIRQFGYLFNKNVQEVSDGYYQTLLGYNWPGNTRELRNAVQYSVAVLDGPILTEKDLAGFFAQIQSETSDQQFEEMADGNFIGKIPELEKNAIRKALRVTNGNKSKAAGILGISKATIHRKLKQMK